MEGEQKVIGVVRKVKSCVMKLKDYFCDKKTVYLNRPINNAYDDIIGMTAYVDRLDAAIDKGARIVAVTSDFGTGKSSLISLYKKQNNLPMLQPKRLFNLLARRKKKVLSINMWGAYSDLNTNRGTKRNNLSVELHKSFIYQVVSLINSTNSKKSSYISRRLSKDYGVLSITSKNMWTTVTTIIALICVLLTVLSYRCQDYLMTFWGLNEQSLYLSETLLVVIAFVLFVFVIASSDIVFSSKNSEGKRSVDENVLIDIFKEEVINHRGHLHYVIVIEDLDRIEQKGDVLIFLRELRKYYLADIKGKHKVSFVVCIKPEALLNDSNSEACGEYNKIFDYVINLQKININNYEPILKGLLKKEDKALEKLKLKANINQPGMEWMIHGKNVDIREVKNRLNEAITLYDSLLCRFGGQVDNSAISFEKCAIATYLRREYESDFYKLEDDALDILVSQYAIKGNDVLEEDKQPDSWERLSDSFKEEIERLIRKKHIDSNYRLYFYNYPSDSFMFTVSEMKVFNSLVYHEKPRDAEDYLVHLNGTGENVIAEAYKKIKALDVIMPAFVLEYDKLFVTLFNKEEDKLWELIDSMNYEAHGIEQTCNSVALCVKNREGEYNREHLIEGIAKTISEKQMNDEAFICIRQRLCIDIPEMISSYKCMYDRNTCFLSSEEIHAIAQLDVILSITNYSAVMEDSKSVDDIHDLILNADKWKDQYAFFYERMADIQGFDKWREKIEAACKHFGVIHPVVFNILKQAILGEKLGIDEYVACLESIENVDDEQISLLHIYGWVNGLSGALCDRLLRGGYYLEYVCNAILLPNYNLPLDDARICNAICTELTWIVNNANKSFWLLRKSILLNRKHIAKYLCLFYEPLPVITEEEIILVKSIDDVLLLFNNQKLTDEQSHYLAMYFNQRNRNATATYNILLFIMKQEPNIARSMFYELDGSRVSYERMSRARKSAITEMAFVLFDMENSLEEKVHYLSFTGVPMDKIEKDLWEELNNVAEMRDEYISYANRLRHVPQCTINNIIHFSEIGTYSEVINQRLWDIKEYKKYVLSKITLEEKFEMEDTKLAVLWPIYVDVFISTKRNDIRYYMSNSERFLKMLVDRKEFHENGDNIELFSVCRQSAELMDFVLVSSSQRDIIDYFSSISGFDGYDAAHRFCEIARENRFIGQSQKIYDNVHGKLINPGLEGWYTKIKRNSH